MYRKKNNERTELLAKAVRFLKNKGYTFIKGLGAGTYGDVIALRNKDSEMIAAKVQHKAYTAPGEIYLWPCLRHPNVLPLLGKMHHKDLDIFVMPLLPNTLCDVLKDANFRNNTRFFDMTIGWIKDMVTGLEYLHAYGVCHMDIKEENILISSDLTAVLADFSGIAETKEPIKRCIMPKCLSPPEIWRDEKEQDLGFDGEKVDLWGAGLVIFNCFSNRWVEKKREKMSLTSRIFSETNKWMCDIYPSIYKCLQEEFFGSLLQSAHPASEITKDDSVMALNLVQGLLRYSPQSRPSAKVVLDHPLFSRSLSSGNLLDPDEIWITKQSDTYVPKSPDNKTDMSQVSAIQSLKVADRIDEETSASYSQLVPAFQDTDGDEEERKCNEVNSIQPDMVNLSNVHSSKDTNDVLEVKKEVRKGSICERIRNVCNRLRKCFRRKKT